MSNRRLLAKVSAPIAALVTLGIFMFLPMYIFRLTADIPLDAQGSNGEIWLLIIGGGLGAGAAYLTFHAILAAY